MVRVFGFGKERVAGMRQSCPKAGFHDPAVLAKQGVSRDAAGQPAADHCGKNR